MIAFLTALLGIGRDIWSGIQAGKAAEELKRDLRDRADVEIDKAIAKRRMADRKKK